jgi:hypothetical protein
MANAYHPCFLLLMRHRDDAPEGKQKLKAVAKRLTDTLSDLQQSGMERHNIVLSEIWHGDSAIASDTAAAVRDRIAAAYQHEVRACASPSFNDMHATPFSGPWFESDRDDALRVLTSALQEALASNSNAVMVVGHQPLLSALAAKLLRRRLPWLTNSVPLARGEVACLAGRWTGQASDGWRLLWTIAPTDEATTQALRSKITAKMQVAGVLASVVATGLILLLQGIMDRSGSEPAATTAVRYAAAAALFVAVWLYLSTVYACDRLLMPTRFWGEPTNSLDLSRRPSWLVWRPPGSDAWVIYQNMLHVWRWQFVPATGALVTAIALLAVDLERPATAGSVVIPILAAAVVSGLLLAYSYWRRPRLGVED